MAYGIEPPIQEQVFSEQSYPIRETEQPKTPPKNKGEDKNQIMFFPKELDEKVNDGYPFVRFQIVDTGISINLPMPPGGVSFNDGANYSTIDLGIVGAVSDAFSLSGEQYENPEAAADNQSNLIEKLKSVGSTATTLIAGNAAPEKIKAIADLAQKKATAKNTHITFQSNNVREFNFTFKLVAKTKDESKQIKNIVDTFRYHLYAELESNGVVVQYPKRWIIQFFHDGKINEYLPDIKISHLKNLTANYNSGTNLFHYDGAPIEIDITLQYQESKGIYKADLLVPREEGYKYAESESRVQAQDFLG